MSTIREVSVEYARTVNLGNYESERLHIGLTATVADDEQGREVAHRLVEEARMTTANWLERFRQERLRSLGRRHGVEVEP